MGGNLRKRKAVTIDDLIAIAAMDADIVKLNEELKKTEESVIAIQNKEANRLRKVELIRSRKDNLIKLLKESESNLDKERFISELNAAFEKLS